MATIVVKDLMENVELDRKAMRKISGGKAGSHSSATYRPSFFKNPLSFSALSPVSFDFTVK